MNFDAFLSSQLLFSIVVIRNFGRSTFEHSLRACETLWRAREIASVALLVERKRHTENVFYMLLIFKFEMLAILKFDCSKF